MSYLCHGVVDIDGGDLELSLLHHLVEVADTGGGLLRQTLNSCTVKNDIKDSLDQKVKHQMGAIWASKGALRRLLAVLTPRSDYQNCSLIYNVRRNLTSNQVFFARAWSDRTMCMALYGATLLPNMASNAYFNRFCLLSCAFHALLSRSAQQ